jgi:hypothetical protein
MMRNMRGERTFDARRQDARQLGPQETQSLPHRDAALQQEGADLIDDAGALADSSFAHTVQRLQVELVDGLGCNNLHGRALHCLGDSFRIAKVVLLSLRVRPTILRRHQPSVVSKHLQLTTEMMRPNASLEADQAWRHIGEPCFDLAARPLLPQHDGSAPVLAYEVKRVLADIHADHGHRIVACSLYWAAPCQLHSLVGQEQGRTIPLAIIALMDVASRGIMNLT